MPPQGPWTSRNRLKWPHGSVIISNNPAGVPTILTISCRHSYVVEERIYLRVRNDVRNGTVGHLLVGPDSILTLRAASPGRMTSTPTAALARPSGRCRAQASSPTAPRGLGERRVPYSRDNERHFPDRGRAFHFDWNALKEARDLGNAQPIRSLGLRKLDG